MPLIYITGLPGTGKSAVRQELLRRGHKAYGGAEDAIAAFYNSETGQRYDGWVEAKDRTATWKAKHTWKIPRDAVKNLRNEAKGQPIFLCAITRNDTRELWDLFDTVIALTVDEATLKKRLSARINNDVGKNPDELRRILEWQKVAEQEYKNLGAIIVDGRNSISDVVNEILRASKKTVVK